MNNNVSPLLDVARADAVSQPKSASSASDTGFSDSFREAKHEYDQAHNQGASEKKVPKDKALSDKEPLAANEVSDKVSPPGNNSSDTAEPATTEQSHSIGGGSDSVEADKVLAKTVDKTVINDAIEVSSTQDITDFESGLASLNTESSVEDILTVLHDMIEKGELEELESLLSPEEIAELVALVDDGKSLPLNPTVISALEAVKQSVSRTLSLNAEVSEKVIAGATPGQEQAVKPGNFTLRPLVDALDSSTTVEKPLVASTNELSTKEFKLDSSALGLSERVTDEGVIKKSLEGELVGRLASEEPKTVAFRLVNELLGPQASASSQTVKPQLSVATPFQQAQWGEAVAERVMWMSSKGIQEAEIHLDPPELGPLQVKVSVANEQAHVSFVVQHGSVREALDQSAMRLREMFEGENIDLVDVDVSDQSEQFADTDREHTTATGVAEEGEQIESETVIHLSNDGYSLINTYV